MDAITINLTEQLLKISTTLKTHNISLSTLLFISCVESEDFCLSEIAEKIKLSLPSMTTMRNCAIDKSFIVEVMKRDKRKKFYSITDLGTELLAGCKQ